MGNMTRDEQIMNRFVRTYQGQEQEQVKLPASQYYRISPWALDIIKGWDKNREKRG
ncbi:MAG: hypothetical protein LBH98_10105 [Chitinispirillales bacterium]|jgi:hypothetical protein|nr:hypothetical protein [Chitinispirillales bacterium]